MPGTVHRPDVVEPEVGWVGGQQQVGEEEDPDGPEHNGDPFPPLTVLRLVGWGHDPISVSPFGADSECPEPLLEEFEDRHVSGDLVLVLDHVVAFVVEHEVLHVLAF